jgi:ATP-dependent exoDNAse (exonuclease V) beta subunit
LALERAKHDLEKWPSQYWENALSSIPYIYVGTIHGYCYRLINQGLIPGFSGNEEMINEVEFSQKMDNLIDLWFETHNREIKNDHLEALVLNKKSLKKSFKEIFSDTDLRMLWSTFEGEETTLENEVEHIKKAFTAFSGNDWDQLRFSLNDATPDSKKPPKYLEFLTDFYEVTKELDDPLSFIEKSMVIFETISRFPSASKKTSPDEAIRALGVIKLWRDFLKKYGTDLKALRDNFDRYQSWGQTINDIYKFTEENYLSDRGLTFTDLEFYCWKAVQNPDVCAQINEGYKYFIVDEFQDTSKVQFDIIKRILRDDMGKVFTVGDVKQAIYGFRGGELGVFKQAQKDTYKNLTLKNNYRSSSSIIRFNNSLFRELLPLAKDYSGDDIYTVPMIEQEVPEGKEEGGTLQKVSVDVSSEEEGKKSLIPNEQNYLEAKVLFNYAREAKDEVCFLYRKLAPTKFLIDELIKGKVGFTCQVKVNLEEDPLICLFLEYSRVCSFPKEEKIKVQSLFQINSILFHLKSSKQLGLNDITRAFELYLSFGLMSGFKRFVWSLGLSSGNLEFNWPTIMALAQASQDKANIVFENSRRFLGGNYSLDFQLGENSQKIKIMTTHASKGLEFSTVILAGIHTNGVSKGGGGFFGKLPHSYKWMGGVSRSKQFSSPTYIYESELNKAKEFSEFKRLFYVATTRAVNRILWCDISFNGKPASFSKSSWIEGIRYWENGEQQTLEGISKSFTQEEVKIVYEEEINEDLRLDLQSPIYHKDNLGLEFSSENVPTLGLGSELSVTRLAMLAQCPRKFFLKNVLKITEDDIGSIYEDISHYEDDLTKASEADQEEISEVFSQLGYSSADRGTEVHRCLEFAIKRNFVVPGNNKLDETGTSGVHWVLNELGHYKEREVLFHSEESLKFSVFGQMVSGTPDLYFSCDGQVQVWDFKTGRSKGKDLSAYWLQLLTYGLALTEDQPGDDELRLVLAFVDEQKIIERKVLVKQVKEELFSYWSLLDKPEQVNTNHCRLCDFDKICQR